MRVSFKRADKLAIALCATLAASGVSLVALPALAADETTPVQTTSETVSKPAPSVLSTMTAPAFTHPVLASPRPLPRPYEIKMPKLRWKSQSKGPAWTRSAMKAVASHGQALVRTVPQDIDSWCPGYRSQDANGRAAFWSGLLSTLSYHESTWRETAVGGGGLWYGLVQIAPPTARLYKCQAGTGEALKNGEMNLSCAVRIMNRTVARDQVVSRGMRGVAADWGPFHSERKREDMRRWLAAQPFCRPMLTSSPIPVARPGSMAPPMPEIPVLPVIEAFADPRLEAPEIPLSRPF
ncbi:transglycosylase SLT domain-containing protein [Celeribacter neptunius]|nr:transglycosylase SLT domain-containing protein [Celeribacter neptunius]